MTGRDDVCMSRVDSATRRRYIYIYNTHYSSYSLGSCAVDGNHARGETYAPLRVSQRDHRGFGFEFFHHKFTMEINAVSRQDTQRHR